MPRRSKAQLLEDARAQGRPLTLAEGRRLFAPKPPTEHVEQVMLAKWARATMLYVPELLMLTAVPHAEQSKAQAGKKWAEGVSAGYPDVLLDVARRGYHGLRIELKRGSTWPPHRATPLAAGEPTPAQVLWHEWLTREGYLVAVCWRWEDARDLIVWYLHPTPDPRPTLERTRFYD